MKAPSKAGLRTGQISYSSLCKVYDAVENDALVRAAADVGEGWREVSELRPSPDVGRRGMAAGLQVVSVRPMSACPLLPASHNGPMQRWQRPSERPQQVATGGRHTCLDATTHIKCGPNHCLWLSEEHLNLNNTIAPRKEKWWGVFLPNRDMRMRHRPVVCSFPRANQVLDESGRNTHSYSV